VEGALCWVDGALEVGAAAFFVAFFFFLAGLRSACRAGIVPPVSTPATDGAATLIGAAFTPAPAVCVFVPPDFATPNAAANAATTATRPMAMERVSMWALLSRAPRAGSIGSEYV
jgi:hypothetical protein